MPQALQCVNLVAADARRGCGRGAAQSPFAGRRRSRRAPPNAVSAPEPSARSPDARVSNALTRFGGCAIVAFVTVSLVGGPWPLVWLAGLTLVLFVERMVHRKLRARCAAGDPPDKLLGLIVWTSFQSSYGNLIAVQLWMAKYVHGETLAVVYLLAGLVNAAGTLRSNSALALAGALPTTLFLIALPIADYLLNGGRYIADLTPLIAVFMFIGFGANMWSSLRAADVATAQAEAAMIRERQAAAAAAAAKSDTIRRISDELRTPMQALIGAAEHLRRVATSPEARTHIGAIAQAGDVLRMVLEDVSDLDRIENDQLAINPQPCDPRELARGVASAFRSTANDKGLELSSMSRRTCQLRWRSMPCVCVRSCSTSSPTR